MNALLGNGKKEKVKEVTFLVDTGSFYPVIPGSLANELGIQAFFSMELILANNKRVAAGRSLAYFRLLDREDISQVVIMDCPEPLLGVTVLEGLGIKVDPATGSIDYSRPYGVAILGQNCEPWQSQSRGECRGTRPGLDSLNKER